VFGFGFFGSGVGGGLGCGLTTGGFSFGGRLSSFCADATTDKPVTNAHIIKIFCNIFIAFRFLFPFIKRLGERGESRVSAYAFSNLNAKDALLTCGSRIWLEIMFTPMIRDLQNFTIWAIFIRNSEFSKCFRAVLLSVR
jgi:hypothetical protein